MELCRWRNRSLIETSDASDIGRTQYQKVHSIASALGTVNSVEQCYAINIRGSVQNRAVLLRDAVLLSDRSDIDQALRDIKQQLDGVRTVRRRGARPGALPLDPA